MIESVGSTIEERKENSNENVKYVKKKTSKNVSEKIVEMEESKEEALYE